MTDDDKNNVTHRKPADIPDAIALGFTKLLRFCADTFFAKRYGNRAIVLETVAAVPGMVGGMLTHLQCLRRMCDDHGWIATLIDEAENERMHLMTFIALAKPTWLERMVVLIVQWVFYCGFFLLYLASARTAHRVVGFFVDDAVIPSPLYLMEIAGGHVAMGAAPEIAKRYWNLPDEATLRDVVLIVRADEAHHRDTNHCFADALAGAAADPPMISAARPHRAQMPQAGWSAARGAG